MNNKIKGHYTSIGFFNNAKIWFDLYRQNIILDNNHKVISIYCALIGFEMLLKSYLIFLNKKYEKMEEMIFLNHDFNKIYNALKKERQVQFLDYIEKTILHYKLFSTKIDTIRYPIKGDKITILNSYYLKPNQFDYLLYNLEKFIKF